MGEKRDAGQHALRVFKKYVHMLLCMQRLFPKGAKKKLLVEWALGSKTRVGWVDVTCHFILSVFECSFNKVRGLLSCIFIVTYCKGLEE